jgi:hypothetical protein
MKLKSRKHFEQAQWFKFNEEVEVLVKTMPFSQHRGLEPMEMMFEQFKYCIVDWKGILDEEGNPLPVNDDNKALIYDFYGDLRNFIVKSAGELAEEVNKQLGN